MNEVRGTQRRDVTPPGDDGADRGIVIEAGMLAFLVGLAVVFLTTAPS